MLNTLKTLFRAPVVRRPVARPAAVPAGQRVYAVGDIHGRRDLFDALIAAVEADDTAAPPAQTSVILLGDLVDRGPDSAGVIAAARAWAERRSVRALAGNHEEMFLHALDNIDVLKAFVKHGGRETILSYGVSRQQYDAASWDELQQLMAAAVPAGDIAFVRSFDQQLQIGDYVFAHAGIRPGTALDAQREADLRWIREPFLSHPDDLGCVVVHGHTISTDVEQRQHRIGIDTGAYFSGRLTALVLEGTERRLIETRAGEDGGIEVHSRSLA